jgi:hypothetical protein
MPCKLATSPGTNRPPTSIDYNQREQRKVIGGRSDFRLVSYTLRFRVPSFIAWL